MDYVGVDVVVIESAVISLATAAGPTKVPKYGTWDVLLSFGNAPLVARASSFARAFRIEWRVAY